jgi:hypothetical protein
LIEAEGGSFAGMLVGRLRVAVSFVAMLMGEVGVLLGLIMLADFVMVSRLMVVMSGSVVVSRGLMVMLGGRMFALAGHTRSPGSRLDNRADSSCWTPTMLPRHRFKRASLIPLMSRIFRLALRA